MVRLTSDRVDKPDSMVWDGTNQTAREIRMWSRDGAGNLRFDWVPTLHEPDQARVLVQRPFPGSPSWDFAPVGTTIVRRDETEDAELYLILPPEPAEVLADEAA
jgi:hypothetical protein